MAVALAGWALGGATAAELLAAEPDNPLTGCAAEGRGFVRVPGTSVCLRIRGEIYSQLSLARGEETSFTTGYEQDRPTADYETADIREEFNGLSSHGDIALQATSDTEQGPLVASIRLRGTSDGGSELREAYIDWAGLTAGFRYSAFDFSTGYAESAGLSSDRTTNLFAFTAEPAPDLTVTVSLEDAIPRRFEDGEWAQYSGQSIPDLVAAIDYAPERGWVHAAAALHHVSDLRGSQSELGWAGILGVERQLRDGDRPSGRILLTGAVARGALDYLGIPVNAPDYIRDEFGELRLSSGLSGLASYEHYWSSKVRSAITASAYRTQTDTESLVWNSEGFWLTVGTEYLPASGLSLGLDVTYYRDVVWAEGDLQPAPADAKSIVGYGYVRRTF